MPKKKLSHAKSIQRTKTIVDLFVSLLIVGTLGYLIKDSYDRSGTVGQTQYADLSQVDEPTDPAASLDPDAIMFSTAQVSTKDKFYGDLILVNNNHEYFSSGDEDLVSIMEMNDANGVDYFTAVDYTYTIIRPAYDAMAQMIKDFYNKYFNDTLIIYGSYRTKDYQTELYENNDPDDKDAPLVAKPGFSEHETGYAFDFSETENYDYDGTGDFEWLNTNCYKYGFVVRYTKDKESITEIRNEPWHFRYVGKPHAYYMTKNNLCLEEYTDLIRNEHPYDGTHLEFSDEDGKNYEVYFYPSNDAEEFTSVPVPSGRKYDISGNNVDGFVVTVYTDEKVDPGSEHPTEAPKTEDENSDSESDTDNNNDEQSGEDSSEDE